MVKYYNGEMYIIPKAFEDEVRADERKKFAEYCDSISADAIQKFAEWLEEKGYLTKFVSNLDEDFDEIQTYHGQMEWLNASDVVAEYDNGRKENV